MKAILSKENAEKELKRFTDKFFIFLDDDNEEDKVSNEILVKAIRIGAFEFKEEKGEFLTIQHLQRPTDEIKDITYHEVTGMSRVCMGNISNESDVYGRLYHMLSNLSGQPVGLFESDMRLPDLLFAEKLAMLFLNG